MAQALPLHMTPELQYLQAKCAAHLPFAVAVNLLKENLPLEEAISISGLKNRARAVGQELDDRIEQAIKDQVPTERASPQAWAEQGSLSAR